MRSSSSRPKGKESRTAELRERLRAAGLRATLPRLEVLRRLAESAAPVSHADLARELVPLGFDRATVYRNLNDLVDAGLASRVELGGHVWRFESRSAEPGHPHFLCKDCGDVVCLATVDIQIPTRGNAQIGDIEDVVLRGRCSSC